MDWQTLLHGKMNLDILVWDLWFSEDLEEKDDSINQSVIAPGLLEEGNTDRQTLNCYRYILNRPRG